MTGVIQNKTQLLLTAEVPEIIVSLHGGRCWAAGRQEELIDAEPHSQP